MRLSNELLREHPLPGTDEPLYRRPVFDLKVRAQKKNPFTRAEQNERAKELYRLGFFAPGKEQQALEALELMEFEGAVELRERLRERLGGSAANREERMPTAKSDTLEGKMAKAQRPAAVPQ